MLAAASIWLGRNLRWISKQTHGDRYFSLPLNERRALRAKIEAKARIIEVLTWPLAALGQRAPELCVDGTFVPSVCSKRAMRFAADYKPETADIFVATQMKCGTTWMQQIVYKILTRGEGEFSDEGHRHMYALSPWIESEGSVHLNDAPLVHGKRIIKTHLSSKECPYSADAKYIYVARHPAACLASSIDFVGKLMGAMAPQHGHYTDWFCSDRMWWGHWPGHVSGWWDRARQHDNVLFVHYEAMLDHPEQSIIDIANFLNVSLSKQQLEQVVHKSSYQFMKNYEYYFEMSPPTPLDTGSQSLLVSGKRDRGNDISDSDRAIVTAFCKDKLQGTNYAEVGFYADLKL